MPTSAPDPALPYRDAPDPGSRFLQIAIIELDGFRLKVFEGEVLVSGSERFPAETETAEISLFPDLDFATVEAKRGGGRRVGAVPRAISGH